MLPLLISLPRAPPARVKSESQAQADCSACVLDCRFNMARLSPYNYRHCVVMMVLGAAGVGGKVGGGGRSSSVSRY